VLKNGSGPKGVLLSDEIEKTNTTNFMDSCELRCIWHKPDEIMI